MTGCRLPRQNELSTGLNIPMKWRRCVQSKKLMLLFLVLISRLATTSGRSSRSANNQCTPKEVACTCTEYAKINATGGFHRDREFKYCGGERPSALAYNGSFCCKWKRANGESCDYCAKLQCPYGYINYSENNGYRGYGGNNGYNGQQQQGVRPPAPPALPPPQGWAGQRPPGLPQ